MHLSSSAAPNTSKGIRLCLHRNIFFGHKGSDLGSFDPQTGTFSFLFNPRTQQWTEHFKFESLTIIGLTPEGRTTVKLLQLNHDERLGERQRLRHRGCGL